MLCQALTIISKPSVNSNWSYSPEMLNLSKICPFFVPCDLEIWWMTLKSNRAPFCATSSFMHHFVANSNQSYSPETLNSGENRSFLSRVTLKFDESPWKTIVNLFYATSSFVFYSIAFSQNKLELQSGNAQFGSKSAFFLSSVTLKFDGWPWKTIGYLFYATSSFVHHFTTIGEFKLELQSRNAQFWVKIGDFWSRVTLQFDGWPWKMIWAHLLYYFKLFASFHNHRLFQTRVTVRKRTIWVKIGDFSFRVTLKFDGWLENQ